MTTSLKAFYSDIEELANGKHFSAGVEIDSNKGIIFSAYIADEGIQEGKSPTDVVQAYKEQRNPTKNPIDDVTIEGET